MGTSHNGLVSLVDCTLREGNQAPGVRFSVHDSLVIARALHETNVTFIEVGHPFASETEFARVAAVARSGLATDVLAHARAHDSDVEAVAESGANWVGIFAGVNEYSQRFRLRKSQVEILDIVSRSVGFAKSCGLRVRYTVEDASRTELPDLLRAYGRALEAGADRICFADSVGLHDPGSVHAIISTLRRTFGGIPIEVHLHDDRGLSMANALAAIAAGATHVSCSVNGIGERSGITDTCALIANLNFSGISCGANVGRVCMLSETVAEVTGHVPDAHRPVTGAHSFTHTSKLHVTAAARNPDCYHWIDPALVGRRATLLPAKENPSSPPHVASGAAEPLPVSE